MAERKTCSNKGCEKKFMAKDNRKKYCSTQCSQKARHKKYKQKKADRAVSSRRDHLHGGFVGAAVIEVDISTNS